MASNGLVTNASKTVYMVLNMSSQEKLNEDWNEVIIGEDKVERSDSTKLLGTLTLKFSTSYQNCAPHISCFHPKYNMS